MSMHEYADNDSEQPHEEDSAWQSGLSESWIHRSRGADIWDPLLTHQQRVLLYAEPLLKLRNRDEHRPSEMKHYDSLSLALELFSQIIENTGLEHEIDNDRAINILLPLLEAMDRSEEMVPDRDRQMLMAERVLGALRNDEE